MGKQVSWNAIVALHHTLETVAFWQPDNILETERGREGVPVGSYVHRRANGTIDWRRE